MKGTIKVFEVQSGKITDGGYEITLGPTCVDCMITKDGKEVKNVNRLSITASAGGITRMLMEFNPDDFNEKEEEIDWKKYL